MNEIFSQTVASYGNESHLNNLRRGIVENFLIKVSMQHKEHVMLEFCDQVSIEMQQKLFKESIQDNIRKIYTLLPPGCDCVLDNSLNLLMFEILTGLVTRYKTIVDRSVSTNLDAIK